MILILGNVIGMLELAPWTIGTVELLVESLALLSFVILGHVKFVVQLLRTVSEGAAVLEIASASKLVVLTHLSLIFSSKSFNVS